MAILLINNEDFTEKLSGFTFRCNKCGSEKVAFDIDWAAYPSASWFKITVICADCYYEEDVYDK